MAFQKPDDYVEVNERIVEFRAKFPEGTLQSAIIRWPEDGFPFVAVQAWAYRTPDDPKPGVGLAWENFPGKTPYTKDSELMNAETSAWGRALIAVGAADAKRGIASAQEVRRGNVGAAPAATSSGATKAAGMDLLSDESAPQQATPAVAPTALSSDGAGTDALSPSASNGTDTQAATASSDDPSRITSAQINAAFGGAQAAAWAVTDMFGAGRSVHSLTPNQRTKLLASIEYPINGTEAEQGALSDA